MYATLSSRAVLGIMAAELEAAPTVDWVDELSWFNGQSDMETETYKMLGRHPGFRKMTGPRVSVPPDVGTLAVRNEKYEATFEVALDDLRRDKTEQLTAYIASMVGGAGEHWADLLSGILANGLTSTSTYGTAATLDGKDFFVRSSAGAGAKHANGQYNVVQVTGFSARVTAAQAEDGLQQTLEQMVSYTDGNGKPINNNVRRVRVIAPPSCVGAVAAALKLELIQGSGGTRQNTAMALSSTLGIEAQVTSEARLQAVDGFGTGATRRVIVLRSDQRLKPLVRQEELGPKFSAKAEGSDFEHDHDAHEYGVLCNRGVGFGRWEYATLLEFAA